MLLDQTLEVKANVYFFSFPNQARWFMKFHNEHGLSKL
jgi:hypothetical protein